MSNGEFYIKDGVKKDGRIVARQVTSVRDAGAYSALNTYVVDKHCFMVSGPYFIPNVYVEGYCVYTNKTPSSSMRGFGVFSVTPERLLRGPLRRLTSNPFTPFSTITDPSALSSC